MQNRGFFTRVAGVLRGAANRAPDDARPSGASDEGLEEEELSASALKARIALKRQDDLVRRREFNYLRKLRKLRRQGQSVSGSALARSEARTEAFEHSSAMYMEDSKSPVLNSEERARTVKKIDDIEAVMLERWSNVQSVFNGAPVPPVAPLDASPAAVPPEIEAQSEESSLLPEDAFDFTQPGALPPSDPIPLDEPGEIAEPVMVEPSAQAEVLSEPDYALPEMQDAALRFAEGDEQGAQDVLLGAVRADATVQSVRSFYCAALFDMYRATGDQAGFDGVAIEYAERFGRSAPEWFSVPERLAAGVQANPDRGPATAPGQPDYAWEATSLLDVSAWRALQRVSEQGRLSEPMDWGALQTIDAAVVADLSQWFSALCNQSLSLQWLGVENLVHVLEVSTQVHDKQQDPVWWRLRLDALRCLGLRTEFESAALDYCVVYEISPPCWSDPRCQCSHALQPQDAVSMFMDSMYSDLGEDPLDALDVVTHELSGTLQGHDAPALLKLQQLSAGSQVIRVSCAHLIRVDFVAASDILNWAIQRENQGSQVHFVDVPLLVAAFFNLMGIDQHAQLFVGEH